MFTVGQMIAVDSLSVEMGVLLVKVEDIDQLNIPGTRGLFNKKSDVFVIR